MKDPTSSNAGTGTRVRRCLKAQRWSQARLAREINLTPFALGRRLRGAVPFRDWELNRIASALSVPVADLIGGEGE